MWKDSNMPAPISTTRLQFEDIRKVCLKRPVAKGAG